jgi:molybdopterin-containing oxidoreductase family iron-sulfur binding subunit
MDRSRRSFLKKAGYLALGAGCGFPLLGAAGRALQEAHGPQETTGKQWGMVVDVEKCLDEEVRRACSDACHREHNVPTIVDGEGNSLPEEEVKWIWPESYRHAFPDQTHQSTPESLAAAPVLVLCNHCTDPPCTRVCPTVATWKRESDGLVMMDMHRCIGCRYCIAACPYGARSFNWRDPRERDENGKLRHFGGSGDLPSRYPARTKGVVEKCNFCAERLRHGLEPACVEAARSVPGGEDALVFGDVSDPDSEISGVLRERRTIGRRVGLGTRPNVFYIV